MALLLLLFIYNILQVALLPLMLLIVFVLQVKKGIIGSLKERIGFVPRPPENKPVYWLHAVSVGEALAVQEFIPFIKQQIPGALCYLTVGTKSAKSIALAQIKADYISFVPYDFLPNVLVAYHRIKPTAVIIVESELWPNLIGIGKIKKVPLFLLNARINPRSEKKFFRFKLFFKIVFNCFDIIFAQSSHDKKLFEQAGIPAQKIDLLGNIKAFNVIKKREQNNQDTHIKSAHLQILLVGSMHPGELDIYLALFKKLKPDYPKLKLILAPRHFGWQQILVDKISHANLSYTLWTSTQPLLEHPNKTFAQTLDHVFKNHDILLVCKLGELFNLYPQATIFYLGGTFVPIGGHNLLEPAAWGIPTIIGPDYRNCKDIADRLEAVKGILKVETPEELENKTRLLLENHVLHDTIGNASYHWVQQESQQVEKILMTLVKVLK